MNNTEIKYLEECELFDIRYKSGDLAIMNEEEMIDIGFDLLAINYAKCCPNIFVTIEQ